MSDIIDRVHDAKMTREEMEAEAKRCMDECREAWNTPGQGALAASKFRDAVMLTYSLHSPLKGTVVVEKKEG